MKFPAKWRPGELLDVRNMGSHYRVRRLNDLDQEPHLDLQQPACQDFVSWWYWPGRDGRHEPEAEAAAPVDRAQRTVLSRRKERR